MGKSDVARTFVGAVENATSHSIRVSAPPIRVLFL